MDPVCHTLVGAALSRAGLDRKTPRATLTLILAANAPDVDIVAAFVGRNLEWRRGVTHGVPALMLWPFVLALAVWAWDRWRRSPGQVPVKPAALAAIAAVGVLSHPFLDYLNSYGMRWLSPFRNQWFYGDSLFIVDPWLYLFLGGGLVLTAAARRRGAPVPARPARIGLWLATIYVGCLIGSTALARRHVSSSVPANTRFMATAVPVNPFVKEVVAEDAAGYRLGRVRLWGGDGVRLDERISRGEQFEQAREVLSRSREGRAFLSWARFPVAVATGEPGVVRVYDLRYSRGGEGWAAVTVRLDRRADATVPPP